MGLDREDEYAFRRREVEALERLASAAESVGRQLAQQHSPADFLSRLLAGEGVVAAAPPPESGFEYVCGIDHQAERGSELGDEAHTAPDAPTASDTADTDDDHAV
jgi:hypothetical protein